VDADQADPPFPAVCLDFHAPLGRQGKLVLGDLVSFGKVRVEVVFPGKLAERRDAAFGRQRGADRILDHFLIEERDASGEAGADRAGMGVGFPPEEGGTAAENFAAGQKLGVNLQADDRFIFHEILPS